MKALFATLLLTGFLSACSVGDYKASPSNGGGHGGHSHFNNNEDK